MIKKGERQNHILSETINILGREGADKLSMRKVAKSADISLSNLQYYYNDRNALLNATVKFYFESCKAELSFMLNELNKSGSSNPEILLTHLLEKLLINGKSNMQVVMFRQIWALSSRDKQLEITVKEYYTAYCKWLIEVISAFSDKPEAVIDLLVPYAEGYAMVSDVLELNKKSIIPMLSRLILNMV